MNNTINKKIAHPSPLKNKITGNKYLNDDLPKKISDNFKTCLNQSKCNVLQFLKIYKPQKIKVQNINISEEHLNLKSALKSASILRSLVSV